MLASEHMVQGARRAPLLAAAALLALWITGGAGGASADGGGKTLRRIHDPVVVPTGRLAGLSTRDTASLRLYRFEDGRPVPIPVQFDPRDRDGEVLVDGPRDFTFDDDDELVFMAKDAGDRAPAGAPPEGWGAALELEIVDGRPDRGARAWAYLVRVPASAPAPAFEPYVTFDTEAQQARSAHYQVEYAVARNFFTGVRVRSWLGGKIANLLRRTRMRGSPTFALPFRDLTLDFTEQNAVIEVDGVRVGPVRAVRRARLSVELGRFFPDLPGGTAYTYHYQTSYLTPSRIGFSWFILKALRDFHFENVLEFVPDAMPITYYDRRRPEGLPLRALGAQEVRTTEDQEWWVHSSEAGTMLHAFVIPPRWRQWGIVRGTVVRAEPDASGGPDTTWTAGYTLHNMTQLREAGSFDLLLASIVLPARFQPGDEEDPLAMVRRPLTTEVRPLR